MTIPVKVKERYLHRNKKNYIKLKLQLKFLIFLDYISHAQVSLVLYQL